MTEEEENTPSASEQVPEEVELIPRRGSTSLAWRWFGFDRKDEGQTLPICKLCHKVIAVKNSSINVQGILIFHCLHFAIYLCLKC